MTETGRAPTESGSDLAVRFGWVSLLQDLGSKMVVPVLTPFLVLRFGASAAVIGLIDGVATVSASLTAPIAGRLGRNPVWWVRIGYSLSSIMKLALAAAWAWPAVLVMRIVDRVGKGIRDVPRDVLLAAGRADHGRVFGIQQAMDKTGGVLGPLVGLAVYRLSGESFDAVFAVAFVPCALSVVLLWNLPGRPGATPAGSTVTGDHQPVAAGSATAGRPGAEVTAAQRRALVAAGLHALGFVTPALLLLRALDVDATVTELLLGYTLLRCITAATSYPIGRLVDARSARSVAIGGMAVSAAAIAAAGLATAPAMIWVALAAAGLADAMTKAPIKAWLLALGPAESRGPVLGDRTAIAGVATLVGSIAVGVAWGTDGRLALGAAAVVALVGVGVALTVPPAAPSVDAVSGAHEP